MSYGISIVNSSGLEVMNTLNTTWNIIGVFEITGPVTHPISTGSYCSEYKVALYHMVRFPDNQEAHLYTYDINMVTYEVTFSGGNIDTLAVLLGR